MSDGYEAAMEHIRERQANLRQCLAEDFPAPTSLVLEMGCGHGHFLAAYAAQAPEQICVGIDLVSKRIRKCQAKADNQQLKNCFFYKAEVVEFLDALPEHVRLESLFMLFPDPWPKKRHFKNRMIQPSLLSMLAQRCASGTPFHYRTDHEGYFQWTREHLNEHPDWVIHESAPWPFEHKTFFEEVTGKHQSLIAQRA